jgi:hypothetical protein
MVTVSTKKPAFSKVNDWTLPINRWRLETHNTCYQVPQPLHTVVAGEEAWFCQIKTSLLRWKVQNDSKKRFSNWNIPGCGPTSATGELKKGVNAQLSKKKTKNLKVKKYPLPHFFKFRTTFCALFGLIFSSLLRHDCFKGVTQCFSTQKYIQNMIFYQKNLSFGFFGPKGVFFHRII